MKLHVHVLVVKKANPFLSLKVLEKLLAEGQTVATVYLSEQLETFYESVSKLSKEIQVRSFQSDCEAIEEFNKLNGELEKLAIGLTRDHSHKVNCPAVMTDISTWLLLDDADVHSCSVSMSDFIHRELVSNSNNAAVNLFVMESAIDQFLTSLTQHLSNKSLNANVIQALQDFASKNWEKNDVVIVKDVPIKSGAVAIDSFCVPLINLIPCRSTEDCLSMVKTSLYRSQLFLWTESVSLIFHVWNKLQFANTYVNGVTVEDACSSSIFFNGRTINSNFMHTCAEMFKSKGTIEPQVAPRYSYNISLKSSKPESINSLAENFGIQLTRFSLDSLTMWCKLDSRFQIMTKAVPFDGTSVSIVLNKLDDLPFVLLAMLICKWELLKLYSPTEVKLPTDVDCFKLDKNSGNEVSEDGSLLFTSDGASSKSSLFSRSFGKLNGFELAQFLIFESSLIKQICIPTTYVAY